MTEDQAKKIRWLATRDVPKFSLDAAILSTLRRLPPDRELTEKQAGWLDRTWAYYRRRAGLPSTE